MAIDALPQGEAHLWYVYPEPLQDAALLTAYDALLTPEERARGARFVPAEARHRHLITRALVRCTLSRYADIAPEAWRFVENAWGRPAIDPACGTPSLRFNLSHTDGLIACLVARDIDVGIDVEDTGRRADYLGVGRRFFSHEEAAALEATTGDARAERFYQLWTLKESYIKARGMGLALPLAAFTFDLRGERPTIAFEPPIEDDPAAWQFSQLRIGCYAVATAVRSAAAVSIRIQEAVPLRQPSS